LEVFGNKLTGTIEFDLGKLTKLSELVLAYNEFQGAAPEGLEKLEKLKFVQIQGNKFNSYEGLKKLKIDGVATFDSDNMELNAKFDPTRAGLNAAKLKDSTETRMADTKFEKDN